MKKWPLLAAVSSALLVSSTAAHAGFAAVEGVSEDGLTQELMFLGSKDPNKIYSSVEIGSALSSHLRKKYTTVNVIYASDRSAYFTVGCGRYNNRNYTLYMVGSGNTQAEADENFHNQLKAMDATKSIKIDRRLYSYGGSPSKAAPAN